ncbi:capsid assembly scaffolding protein Gp46 family protein, partial [Staphylococcus epidermidis]|uniref:capsid assembly scaffolding protein Gp46 family protein n=1 Tax=Staphylococcus epidermidis TaxID=1282 RepID=UPI0028FD746A
MNVEDIKSYFEEHKDDKDVKEYLSGLKTVSVDDVKGFLDTEEGKRFIQPELDRYHTKGLESWKEKNLENLIEKEVKERNPEQSEEQKRITALEQELEKR